MPFDDLDLEFEDEDEVKKNKKSDAVAVDVDLEFHGAAPTAKPAAKPVAAPAEVQAPAQAAAPKPTPVAKPVATVQNIDAARAAKPAVVKATGGTSPKIIGTSALALEPLMDSNAEEVIALREHARKVEFDASVKVAIAEHKTELLSELLSDIKLMDHQVGQLLARINAKHPDMKQEVLMIKKILADFTAKKRK